MRRSPSEHPLLRELRIGHLVGWPVVAVTLLSGIGCAVMAIVLEPGVVMRSEAWLFVPASIPLCFCLLSGRSILIGALGGFFAATIAFLTVGAYVLWQVACFVITFMGDC